MKVTQQTLPLFNEMYELKFSEEEMTKAFSVQEEVAKKLKDLGKPFKHTSVGSINHVIDNGINTITHTMYLNDDWGGRLEIHAGQVPQVLDSDGNEQKQTLLVPVTTSYFEFASDSFTNSKLSIKVKTIDAEQFHTLLENLHFCHEMGIKALNKEERDKFRSMNICDDLTWFIEVTNGPRILEKLKLDELNKDTAINTTMAMDDTFDQIQSMCDWLMPNAKITSVTDDLLEKKLLGSGTRENPVGYIESVYEKDNYRLGILAVFTNDYYRTASHRRIFLLSHTDALFNYADAKRVIIFGRKNYYSYNNIFALDKNAVFGKVIFTEEITLPTTQVLLWMARHVTGDNTQLCDASQLKLSIKKFSEETRREKEAEEEKKILEAKLKERLEGIKTGKKKLILNGMTVQKDKIEYEGQTLSRTDSSDWVYNILYDLSRAHQFDDINWDATFEQFVSSASWVSSEGQLGEVKFKLVYDVSTNTAGIDSTKTYLNEYRINKAEISDCLRRAVCYTTQEDFDEFLANVSSCSLKFHRYLQTGVDFEVSGMRYNEGFSFKLPLERRKNLMYIVLGDNEYKVRDTNRLINMQNLRDLGEIMELLLGDKVIEGMTIDDAKSVLKLAKIEYQDAIDKSKKLLDETEKTLKLSKQENIQMNEVTVKEGYIVNGKLRQYVVANTDKCEVYEYPSGRYICIVDKSTSQVGKDKLINRLYALTNDQALAQDIHTLN